MNDLYLIPLVVKGFIVKTRKISNFLLTFPLKITRGNHESSFYIYSVVFMIDYKWNMFHCEPLLVQKNNILINNKKLTILKAIQLHVSMVATGLSIIFKKYFPLSFIGSNCHAIFHRRRFQNVIIISPFIDYFLSLKKKWNVAFWTNLNFISPYDNLGSGYREEDK